MIIVVKSEWLERLHARVNFEVQRIDPLACARIGRQDDRYVKAFRPSPFNAPIRFAALWLIDILFTVKRSDEVTLCWSPSRDRTSDVSIRAL